MNVILCMPLFLVSCVLLLDRRCCRCCRRRRAGGLCRSWSTLRILGVLGRGSLWRGGGGLHGGRRGGCIGLGTCAFSRRFVALRCAGGLR